jgi:hypothetical protein
MTDAIYLDTDDLNTLKGLLHYLNESFAKGATSGAVIDASINISDCNGNHLGMVGRNEEGTYVYWHGFRAEVTS